MEFRGGQGVTNSKMWKEAKQLDRSEKNKHKYAYSSGNGHELTINPLIPERNGVYAVINSYIWETFQTTGPIRTKFGTRIQIHKGMDIG